MKIPHCGYTTIYNSEAVKSTNLVKVDNTVLENNLIKVIFNNNGEIISIFDKAINREMLAEVGNTFKMYKDIPTMFDVWDIDSMYNLLTVPLDEKAEIVVENNGALFATLLVKRKINNSFVTQKITLQNDTRWIDFETVVDWQETHKLLNVEFSCKA